MHNTSATKLKVLISRTDAIGDVILTIPILSILKENIGISELHLLGKSYTEDVVLANVVVDKFINFDVLEALQYDDQVRIIKAENYDAIVHVFPNQAIARLARDSGIPMRIGTASRWFHWLTCNKLVQLNRKMSDLHEAQLNLKLLKAFDIKHSYSLEEIFLHFKLFNVLPLPTRFSSLLADNKLNIILHPKSNKSAREWGLQNFLELINLLPKDKFKIFISGTNADKTTMTEWLKLLPAHVVDITGTMTLKEFISFIHHSDGLLAASTGPLHIAAALGNNALGLYPPMRPIFPRRWAPIGPSASYLVSGKACKRCEDDVSKCECMKQITPSEVAAVINTTWRKRESL